MNNHLCFAKLKITTMVFVFAIILGGCSSSYLVSSTGKPNADISYGEMNKELRGYYATVELKEGMKIFTNQIKITSDSVSLFDYDANTLYIIQVGKIKKIVVKSHLIGFLEGLGLGAIGGGIVGSVIGANDNHSATDGPIKLYLFLISTAGGAGLGSITGLILGHSYIYEFRN